MCQQMSAAVVRRTRKPAAGGLGLVGDPCGVGVAGKDTGTTGELTVGLNLRLYWTGMDRLNDMLVDNNQLRANGLWVDMEDRVGLCVCAGAIVSTGLETGDEQQTLLEQLWVHYKRIPRAQTRKFNERPNGGEAAEWI